MKYALLLADWPTHMLPNAGLDQEWQSLLGRVRDALKSLQSTDLLIEEFHAGAWLVPVTDGLRVLSALRQAVDGEPGQSWGYRILFFEDKPNWLLAPSQR